VGLPIRLFLVDTTPFADDSELTKEESEQLDGFKKAFINAEIIEENGEEWAFNEGCLSIPNVREDVYRQEEVLIRYLDENFEEQTDTYHGLIARVIQHEYDHIEGVLFTDKISSLKKRLIKGRLSNISKGKTNVDYRMRFPDVKGRRQ
jgi:peptide deformylase